MARDRAPKHVRLAPETRATHGRLTIRHIQFWRGAPPAASLTPMPAPLPFPLRVQLVVLLCVGWLNQRQQAAIEYLREENRVLREQLGSRRLRLTDAQRRRLAARGQALGGLRLAELATVVTPATILRWYRDLIARKYTPASRTGPGRPPLPTTTRELVLRLARENLGFGYTRIRDALREVGVEVGRSTIAAVLREHGLPPAPTRRRSPTWKQFLSAHFDVAAAADFFHVEVMTLTGLARYKVFFVLHLATRRVQVAGIARDTQVTGRWLVQLGRNLTDACDGFLREARYLIVDRDPLYTTAFCDLLASSGVTVVKTPPSSPNLNAFAERWVRSVRSELLDHVVILGEAHLRRLLSEYVRHYHHERHHQGLGGRLLQPDGTAGRTEGPVRCRERLGGLLRYYYREPEAA